MSICICEIFALEVIMTKLYDRILQQTTQLGLTGKDLGSMLGLKKSPLTDWKNHKSTPTLEQLAKMCEIFAVSSDYLLFGKVNTLSDSENLLLEKYNLLPPAEQKDLLEYAEYKVHQHLKKSSEVRDSKTKERYSNLNPENSSNIIA